MKHLILLLFALLLLGCKDNGSEAPEVIEQEAVRFKRIACKQGFLIYEFTYKNHDYICNHEGFIIHSQSCRCLNP